MDKKGFLLAEETLKIVLAVIGIGFLVFLLVSMYYSYADDRNLRLAQSYLEDFSKQLINPSVFEVELTTAPDGWILSSWPYGDGLPQQCRTLGYQYCLCLCRDPTTRTSDNRLFGTSDPYLNACNNKGTCIDNPLDFSSGNTLSGPIILIDTSKKLSIDRTTKHISLSS